MRAWRFSYNARGIIEMPNRLKLKQTAVIMVHPWGIDDENGWLSPEPAGCADFCTPIYLVAGSSFWSTTLRFSTFTFSAGGFASPTQGVEQRREPAVGQRFLSFPQVGSLRSGSLIPRWGWWGCKTRSGHLPPVGCPMHR